MPASIKRDKTQTEVAGITSGKDYAVQGYTGGGAIIINDESAFYHVGFAHIGADWTVTDQGAKKEKTKEVEPTKAKDAEPPVEPSKAE